MSATVHTARNPAEPAAASVPSRKPVGGLKPRCALKVAVVGNRRFGGEPDEASNEAATLMKRQAARACTAVWEVVVEAVPSALALEVRIPPEHQRSADRLPSDLRLEDFYGDETPRLAVLSSLAAGADQIGAETALQVGRIAAGVEVELEAVLPFREQDYPGRPGQPRREFRGEEASALASLAAEASQVVRLDGRYSDERSRNLAYRDCRDMLLQHADMLVAVYDPWAEGGRAGTVETVERALAAGLPVVAILVAEDEARIAIYNRPSDRPHAAEVEWAGADPLDGEEWRPALAEEVRYLLALPRQLPVPGESAHEREKRLKSLAESVNRLRLVYGEAPTHRWCRVPAGRFGFAWAWQAALRVGALFSHPPELGDVATRPDPVGGASTPGPVDGASRPEGARDEITMPPYAAYYDRASALSDAYMRTYRGAFVLAFTLAGVAVAAAVLLMAASHPDVADWLRRIGRTPEGWWLMAGDPPLLATLFLGGGKILIIAFLLFLERVSHQARYQEHATDFRYLAEKIRPMQWLAPVGTVVPAVDLPAHLAPQDPRRGWMPWLVRAVARGTPPVSAPAPANGESSTREVRLDGDHARAALERARSQWLEGQVRYHRNNVRRMHGLDEGIERLAKRLLWTVLVFAMVALALKLLYKPDPAVAENPAELTGAAVALRALPLLLGAFTAMLPAFIAALGGIMFQSEARRLAARSEAMYHALRIRQGELGQQIAVLSGRAAEHDGAGWAAAQHLRALSEMMIEETGDWKVLYETHEIHAG